MPAASDVRSPRADWRRGVASLLLAVAAVAACSRQPAPAVAAQGAADARRPPAGALASDPATGAPVTDTAGRVAAAATAGAAPPVDRSSAAAPRYDLAPSPSLAPAVVAAERALAAARPAASSRAGAPASPAPAAVSDMSLAAVRSLVPMLALVADVDAGAASDSSAPVAAAASRAAKKASLAQRSGAWLQKGLAWTSIGLGLAGVGVAIAGGDESTTAALALAGTVTGSITALLSIRKPGGVAGMTSSAADAPLSSASRAPGDTTQAAGTTKLDSAAQALAGEAFATRLALDLRVGARSFAALRDEAAALVAGTRDAGADYASLAPRAAAMLDVEAPRLLGLARAGAESPLMPASRRPALLDAVARLDAAQGAWRRDRALHARAERVAVQAVAAR